MFVTRVGAIRSQAMVVSVLVAVGWMWMHDSNYCNPDRGYWVPWHCSARLFTDQHNREEAQRNHIYNVDPRGVLTWSFDVFELAEPSPPQWQR